MRKGIIYTLRDPRNELVRYIGKTVHPQSRLSCHIAKAQENWHKKSHVQSWIYSLLKENIRPVMETIAEFNEDELLEKEKQFIKLYSTLGAKLCNCDENTINKAIENRKPYQKKKKEDTKQRKKAKKEASKVIQKTRTAVIDAFIAEKLKQRAEKKQKREQRLEDLLKKQQELNEKASRVTYFDWLNEYEKQNGIEFPTKDFIQKEISDDLKYKITALDKKKRISLIFSNLEHLATHLKKDIRELKSLILCNSVYEFENISIIFIKHEPTNQIILQPEMSKN